MNKNKLNNFKIINNKLSSHNISASALSGCTGCDAYSDAPVCKDGTKDVLCPELYKGCSVPPDCADCPTSSDRWDDRCCWGPLRGGSDNIDHAYCDRGDSDWRGINLCLFWDSGNPPGPPGEY